MNKLTTMEALIFFKKIPMFRDLDINQLLLLKDISDETEFKSGDYIIKEGEYGDEAYIIVSGSVEIIKTKEGKDNILVTIEKGDYFGEMAIIEDEPRSASARAKTECMLLVIKGSSFKEMIKNNADISFNLVKVFSNRVRNLLAKS